VATTQARLPLVGPRAHIRIFFFCVRLRVGVPLARSLERVRVAVRLALLVRVHVAELVRDGSAMRDLLEEAVGATPVRVAVDDRVPVAAGVRVDDKLTEPVLVALLEGVPVELLLLLPVPDSLALGVGLCVADTDAV